MGNLDLIILTSIVSILYIGFAITLFVAQTGQQHHKTNKVIPK